MKSIVLAIMFSLPVFSNAVKLEQVEGDRFDQWYKCKSLIEDYGSSEKITKDMVLEWAKIAIQTRVDNISDIEDGKEIASDVPINYVLAAEIYRVTFYKLSEWGKYERLIYDIEREEEAADKLRMAKEWPNCSKYNDPKELENLEGIFTDGRIERKLNGYSKREFLRKALPHLYLLKMENYTWLLAKKSAVAFNDEGVEEIADLGIEGSAQLLRLIDSIKKETR